MKVGVSVTQLKNFFRFRSALAQVQDDSAFMYRLKVWQHVAHKLGFEFMPAKPLGNSSLQGSYQGLATEIAMYFEEIRIITRFSISLSTKLLPGLLEHIQRGPSVYEQSNLLLTEIAEHTGKSTVDIAKPLGSFTLGISARYLSCDIRYISEPIDYFRILSVLSEAAQVLTIPSTDAEYPHPMPPRFHVPAKVADENA